MARNALRMAMIAEFLRQPQVLVTMVATVDAADQVRTVCVLPVPCLRKKPSPRALPISVVAINDPLSLSPAHMCAACGRCRDPRVAHWILCVGGW